MITPAYFEGLAEQLIGHLPDVSERFGMLEFSETEIRIREQLDVSAYMCLVAMPNSALYDARADNPHELQYCEIYIVKLVDANDYRQIRKVVYEDCKAVLYQFLARIRKDRQEYVIHDFDLNKVDLEPVFGFPEHNYFGHTAKIQLGNSVASKLYVA
jgi:hypothetical protein